LLIGINTLAKRLGWTAALLAASVTASPVAADPQTMQTPYVQGLYNWIYSTGDAERSFRFLHDVFGIELAPHTFAGGARPEGILPADQARSDALIWDLTNTHGSRARTVFMSLPNARFGLELSEFFDIPRGERPPNPWDPGASRLVFAVRDFATILASLKANGAVILTRGGGPIETPEGSVILVRAPDGYLIEVRQASPAAITGAGAGTIISTAIGITVADLATVRAFYGDLLGLTVVERSAAGFELALNGLSSGAVKQVEARVPGAEATIIFTTFTSPTTTPHPYQWKIQDIGAPQFQFEVRDLDELIERTQRAGYSFLSVNARPTQRPFGRFVFAIDADGVLVEYVEPAPDATSTISRRNNM
jgi:catechol 2,3-dioxygenase-like lactoylglutathione lyase family enzyme